MGTAAIAAAAYLLIGAVLILLGISALFMIGLERLSGSAAIERDGLRRGTRAPVWRQPDSEGVPRGIADGRWKFVVFADHSIRSFPGVGEALNALHRSEPDADVIVASRASPTVTQVIFRAIGLQVPTISVDSHFYRRHRVRVMPFAIVIDPIGIVRASGLIDTPDAVVTVWRVAYLLPLAQNGRRRLPRLSAYA